MISNAYTISLQAFDMKTWIRKLEDAFKTLHPFYAEMQTDMDRQMDIGILLSSHTYMFC